jgi:hypothetical protein
MLGRFKVAGLPLALVAALSLAGCQKTSNTSTSVNVDTFVDSSSAPAIAVADGPGTGKTYRVVRGNNQPDDILEYQYHASFTTTVTINNHATDDSVKLAFPVTLSSATLKVQQASGGIVTPPTGTDVEHYEFVSHASGNTVGGVGGAISVGYDIWYTLPSGGKEALVTLSYNFTDDSSTPKTFTKTVNVRVAP